MQAYCHSRRHQEINTTRIGVAVGTQAQYASDVQSSFGRFGVFCPVCAGKSHPNRVGSFQP